MDKRYQVFVSSTFRDLIDERREVMQALLEMDCIPSGMELFPAANDQAWKLIKRVIDESDYYCLIIGGRYGSTDERGLSYTEREYDYALKIDLPILPFVHSNPDEIPAGKVDRDEKAAKRLRDFREKVEKNHHCKYWAGAEDLGGKVSRAMIQVFKLNPRTGWVRADQVLTTRTLRDMENLRQRADQLQAELDRLRAAPPAHVEGLANGDDLVPAKFSYKVFTGPPPDPASSPKGTGRPERTVVERIPLTWDGAFSVMGQSILAGNTDNWDMEHALEKAIGRVKQEDSDFIAGEGHSVDVERPDVAAILTQFVALGLVEVGERIERGRTTNVRRLTPHGLEYLLRNSTVRKADQDRRKPTKKVRSRSVNPGPVRRQNDS